MKQNALVVKPFLQKFRQYLSESGPDIRLYHVVHYEQDVGVVGDLSVGGASLAQSALLEQEVVIFQRSLRFTLNACLLAYGSFWTLHLARGHFSLVEHATSNWSGRHWRR